MLLVVLALFVQCGLSDSDSGMAHTGTDIVEKEREILAGENTTGHPSGGHEAHSYYVLLPLFTILLIGCVSQLLISRYLPQLPYTLLLMAIGILIGILYEYSSGTMAWNSGLKILIDIDPHLLLALFLPALVFGDAININTRHFKKCFGQCVLLASTGVLFGMAITGVLAKYILPMDWSWSTAMMFGSIMAATDPVAVVALLKDVGASPILTMQIMGESLLNDGAAIVVYNLFYNMVTTDKVYTAGEVVVYFLQMALAGPVIGACFGFAILGLVALFNRKTSPIDSVTQISFTIAVSYTVYYTSEFLCHSSGVLGTVFAGVVLAKYVWPYLLNREAVHEVWEVVEFLANTVLFCLAGIIYGASVSAEFNNDVLFLSDYGYLFLFFFFMVAIRFIMIFIHYPILKLIGYGCSLEAAIFMAWGGLRGAVGLALAVTYLQFTRMGGDLEAEKNAVYILFYVGGCAFLSMLILAPTSSMVLNKLGLTKPPASKEKLFAGVDHRLANHCQNFYQNLSTKAKYKEHHTELVMSACPMLEVLQADSSDQAFDAEHPVDQELLIEVRRVFLSVVRSAYWELIESGHIPNNSVVAKVVLASIDYGMENSKLVQGMMDFKFLRQVAVEPTCLGFGDALDKCLPESIAWDNVITDTVCARDCIILLDAFLEANEKARHAIAIYFGEGTGIDSPEEHRVVLESKENCMRAENMLKLFSGSTIKASRSIELVSLIQNEQIRFIHEVIEEGILSMSEGQEKLNVIETEIDEMHKELRALLCKLARGDEHDVENLVQRVSFALKRKSICGGGDLESGGSELLPLKEADLGDQKEPKSEKPNVRPDLRVKVNLEAADSAPKPPMTPVMNEKGEIVIKSKRSQQTEEPVVDEPKKSQHTDGTDEPDAHNSKV